MGQKPQFDPFSSSNLFRSQDFTPPSSSGVCVMHVNSFRHRHALEAIEELDVPVRNVERLQSADHGDDGSALVDTTFNKIARNLGLDDVANGPRELGDPSAGLCQQRADFEQEAPLEEIQLVQIDRLQTFIEMGIDTLDKSVEPSPVRRFDQFANPVRQPRRMPQFLLVKCDPVALGRSKNDDIGRISPKNDS